MSSRIEREGIVGVIREALPRAVPNTASSMFSAQVQYLDAAEGMRVVDQIGKQFRRGQRALEIPCAR